MSPNLSEVSRTGICFSHHRPISGAITVVSNIKSTLSVDQGTGRPNPSRDKKLEQTALEEDEYIRKSGVTPQLMGPHIPN